MALAPSAISPDRLFSSGPGLARGGIELDEDSSVPSSRSIPAPVLSPSPALSLVPGSRLPPEDSFVSSPLIPEDPVSLAWCLPDVAEGATSSRFDSFVAALELCSFPASAVSGAPLPGGSLAEEAFVCFAPALHPRLDSSHCPVRASDPSVLGCSKASSVDIHSNFKFNSLSFPPLPKVGGPSVSAIPPPPSVAASPASCPAEAQDEIAAVSPAPGAAKLSWASLVSEDSAVMELSYRKPSILAVDGRLRCSIPPEVAICGAAAWENTIVGFFLDKLPFSLVNSQAHRLWDASGLLEVLSNGNGFFFFKFRDKASSLGILKGGPWYFGGRPIFLKPWRTGMNLSKEGCNRVPIWAHFYNVPLEFWSAEGLSHLASNVGIPLHADKMTSSLKRLAYARICIEIGIDDPLPNSLDLVLGDGNVVEIRIDYNWVPKKCSSCKAFGHLPNNCKMRPRQSWVPKVPPPSSDADVNPILQSSAGNKGVDVSSSRPGRGSIVSLEASNGLPSTINPIVKASGSGFGGSSSNSFVLLQDMEDDHDVHEESSLELQRIASVGVSVPPTVSVPAALDSSLTLGPIALVPPAADSGLEVSPNGSGFLSSPSSLSSTPLLARKLNLVDELDKKQGKKIKSKKKSRNAGNSKGKTSLFPDD